MPGPAPPWPFSFFLFTRPPDKENGKKTNVFLGGLADNEGFYVHYLLTDSDMVLADQHSGEVDGLSQGKHEDISKKPFTVRPR